METLKISDFVPSQEMEVYDPEKDDFGIVSFDQFKNDRKWLILVFYPADFTFICPTELKDISDLIPEFKKLGVEVLSVSTDTKFVHLAWKKSEKLLKDLKFSMVADPTGDLSRLFGVYNEKTGLARRGTFIINPDGMIVGMEVSFDNVGRNAKELLRKLKAHIYVANNPGEVCPAAWEEGKKTLKPGAKLVGKVGENI